VKDSAQGASKDVAGDVPQDVRRLGLRGPGGARPPRQATTAAVFVQLALRLGAQLGSSVALGSGCGQLLPGVPRKAPLC